MLERQDRMALDALADELGRSRSEIIREAVRVWLKKNARGLEQTRVGQGWEVLSLRRNVAPKIGSDETGKMTDVACCHDQAAAGNT